MKRRRAREQAFLLLFANSFRDEGIGEVAQLAVRSANIKISEFALGCARGATEHVQELDEIISSCLKGWTISRISRVSLAVLRLALYEMKYVDDIPVNISINEAVEITKKFADKKESSFVNGVLGTAAKQIALADAKVQDAPTPEDTGVVPGEDTGSLLGEEESDLIDESGAAQ